VPLADLHDLRVELVVETDVLRQRRLEKPLHAVVVDVLRRQPVPREEPLRVGVDHERRPVQRVEQDRVGRFRPDPIEVQQLGAQDVERRLRIVAQPPRDDRLQALRLEVVVAGGPDDLGEATDVDVADALGIEQLRALEVVDGLLDVGPGGVLGEDGADDDLEGGIRGPPPPRAVAPQEDVEVPRKQPGWFLRRFGESSQAGSS
jgi:hypothetical protein